MSDKKVVNLEDFFTEDNEQQGVWFEPKINDIPCGFEFLVTGVGTDENVANSERYEKALAETDSIKDPIERVKKQKVLDANRVAEFVKGIRASSDTEVMFDGKPLEYSVPLIQKILLKSPLIKLELVRFAKDTTNFIKGKKNV